MTHEQAIAILDRLKCGIHYPKSVVDYALYLTGDIDVEPIRPLDLDGSIRWGERVCMASCQGTRQDATVHGYQIPVFRKNT